MASRKKTFHANLNSMYPSSDDVRDHNPLPSDIEFDEADIWSTYGTNHVAPLTENKRTLAISRQAKKVPRMIDKARDRTDPASSSTSLPLNIPDWSKILKEDYVDHRNRDSDEDFSDDNDDEKHGNYRLPPHEYLARTRAASFSVHEGIGRTLKGRDLRRVRNAIWKKVGFED